MDNLYYRFRDLDKLLGEDFQELKRQTIYFASPEEQNDPMDGFREFFWEGDKVVWKNLFKNFLICLEKISSLFLIVGEDERITDEMIPVFSTKDDFPTPQYMDIYCEIEGKVFNRTDIDQFITSVSNRTTKIFREELSHYLKRLHPIFLKEIFTVYKQKGLLKDNPLENFYNQKDISQILDTGVISNLEKIISSSDLTEDDYARVFFDVTNNGFMQQELLQRYNGVIGDNSNKNFLLIEFVEHYIDQLENLVYPKWYASCFMTECNNSSVWGNYGDKHRGVCLIFKPDTDEHGDYIPFNDTTGWSNKGEMRGEVRYRFKSINYDKKIVSMNFFNFLGSLPTGKIDNYWYRDGENYSQNALQFKEDMEEWRKKYWSLFYDAISRKSKDWAYECEERLIINDMFREHSDPKKRTLKYNFRNLDGVIFGIKTPIESKLEIMKILDEKCVESQMNHIKYYQAYYSHKTDRIEYDHLSFIEHKMD